MTIRLVGLYLALALAGCAGTDTQLRMLEQQGAFQITPVQGKAWDYDVRIANLWDVGYDPEDKDTRYETALRGLRVQCPGGRVVGEDIIEKGTYPIGRKARDYFIHVKCG